MDEYYNDALDEAMTPEEDPILLTEQDMDLIQWHEYELSTTRLACLPVELLHEIDTYAHVSREVVWELVSDIQDTAAECAEFIEAMRQEAIDNFDNLCFPEPPEINVGVLYAIFFVHHNIAQLEDDECFSPPHEEMLRQCFTSFCAQMKNIFVNGYDQYFLMCEALNEHCLIRKRDKIPRIPISKWWTTWTKYYKKWNQGILLQMETAADIWTSPMIKFNISLILPAHNLRISAQHIPNSPDRNLWFHVSDQACHMFKSEHGQLMCGEPATRGDLYVAPLYISLLDLREELWTACVCHRDLYLDNGLWINHHRQIPLHYFGIQAEPNMYSRDQSVIILED